MLLQKSLQKRATGTLSQLLLSYLTCLTSLTDVLAFCTPFSDMLALCHNHGGPTVPHSALGRQPLQSQCSWLICSDHDHDSADLSGKLSRLLCVAIWHSTLLMLLMLGSCTSIRLF